MNKLRELAERWKRNDAGDTEIVAYAINEAADELLAILDAEGDGGAVEDAVPRGWISHRRIVGIPDKDFYGKLPIQSMQPGVYSHTPLFDKPPPRPPIIVPPYVSADDANRMYGERFGMDWKYEAITADTFRKLHPPAQAAQVDARNAVMVDRGALRMAMNVLRRAGKDEVCDALEAACAPTAEPVAQAGARALLPCPFCGGECKVVEGVAAESVWRHGVFHRVFCTLCQARQLFHKTEAEAVSAWNSRLDTQPRAVPDGMVLVPREPTEAMAYAALNDNECSRPEDSEIECLKQAYRAMLAAAPSPGESA